MTLKLRPSPTPGPSITFSWDKVPSSPHASEVSTAPPSPPTQWLTAKDMKLFGATPLQATVGVVRCKDCDKAVLRSAMSEHADQCLKYRNAAKKAGKGKGEEELKKGKKRKAEDEPLTPDDPSAPKKKKPMTKVTKGRMKGPVDLDKQCGVINDKGLPCSRSLTCKSHSMGSKRAVQGRSRPYDELLLEWNRLHNPNFVEPVKRESKQERKERKEKEKAEKKRLQMEAAAAAGIDLTKKAAGTSGTGAKKKKAATAATTAPTATSAAPGIKAHHEPHEDEDIDSEAEVDVLVHAVRAAESKGILGVPLAVPCDASSWFVTRRERVRTCRELLASALFSGVRPAGTAGTIAAAPARIAP